MWPAWLIFLFSISKFWLSCAKPIDLNCIWVWFTPQNWKNEMSDFLDVYFQLIHPEQIIKQTMRLLLISDFTILMWRRCMSFMAQLSYLNKFTIRYISHLYLEKCGTHIANSIFKNIFVYIYIIYIYISYSYCSRHPSSSYMCFV